MTSTRRALVIGLDGATWDLMAPWIEAGYLPNLATLRARGARGKLASTIHPVTTPAWTSFLTGQQQGRHGIYDHVRRRPGTYEVQVTNASMIRVPTIFDHLRPAGLRAVSLNVPYTFPPRPIPGVMVSGLFAPTVGPQITYPSELFAEIARVAPDYTIHPDFVPQAPDPLQRYVDDLIRSTEGQFKVAEYLMAREPWSLFVVVFTATDQVQHSFWHCLADEASADSRTAPYRHAIRDVYQAIDRNLPRLLSRIDDETLVIVMSDHGAGELHRWVHLNRWLADHGYLTFTSQRRRASWRTALLTRAAAAYKRHVPAGWRARVRQGLGRNFERAKSTFESQLFSTAIAWERSRAYALGACGNLFINLRGREPRGIVAPGAEYEALRDEIAAQLLELRDPETGDLLVARVFRREEIYHGPYLDQAPDLVIQWRDYRYWGRGRYDQFGLPLFEPSSTWDFSELPLTGTHRPDGVLIACGPGIGADRAYEGARLIDLAPTLLAYLGVPVPADMDGRVLADLFAPGIVQSERGAAASAPQAQEFAFTPDEEAAITQRLQDLGYL